MSDQLDVAAAAARIRGFVRETPLARAAHLSRLADADVHLKLENHQVTGSFKARGAFNKLLAQAQAARGSLVVAASSGNHGAAIAYAAGCLGARARVYVPKTASPAKVQAIRDYGAEACAHGTDCVEAEAEARAVAAATGGLYVSPYNDPLVVEGQGTVGLEICAAAGRPFDAAIIAVGGGGLIAGAATALKAAWPQIEVIGASPAGDAAMAASLAAGRIVGVEARPTLSDGTAGGIEAGSVTFPLCRALIDGFITVDEAAIRAAMRILIGDEHLLVEGAAAVPLAALLAAPQRFYGKRVVLVLCGANVARATLAEVLRD